MTSDSRVVDSLVERLATKLPHRTGYDTIDLQRDELTVLTRATLLDISVTSLSAVVEALVALLGDLASQYGSFELRPIFFARSEAFVVQLLADCCTASSDHNARANDDGSSAAHQSADGAAHVSVTSSVREEHVKLSGASELGHRQANSLLRTIIRLLDPNGNEEREAAVVLGLVECSSHPMSLGIKKNGKSLEIGTDFIEMEGAVFTIVHYLAATNWDVVFHFFQEKLNNLGIPYQTTANLQEHGGKGKQHDQLEAISLVGLRVLPYLAGNKAKLGSLLQEICGSFLHLRKSAQMAVAALLPQAILAWIEEDADEFVEIHLTQRRLEGGPDVLFDMASSIADTVRHRRSLLPLQFTLTLLIPEIFWVVSNMREARSNSVTKKAAFIDGLRKNMRSSKDNDTSACCMITLCRVAAHFSEDEDSALLSYALDVQDELRREVFETGDSTSNTSLWKRADLMTAAFISLAHLDIDSLQQLLVRACSQLEGTMDFKIATFNACAKLAAGSDSERFAVLFRAVGTSIHESFKAAVSERKETAGKYGLQTTKSTGSRELILAILKFLSRRPESLFEGAPEQGGAFNQWLNEGVHTLTACLADDDESIRLLASELSRWLMVRQSVSLKNSSGQGDGVEFLRHFWVSTSLVLSAMANKLLEIPLRQPGCKIILTFIHEFLEARTQLLKVDKGSACLLDGATDIAERNEASCVLEVAFLVLLCSSDLSICSAATGALGLLCQEGCLTESMDSLARCSMTVMRNYEAYSELNTHSFPLTGLVAFQKRFRRLLLKLSHPTAGVLAAWERVFSRWKTLNMGVVGENRSELGLILPTEARFDEEDFIEWRNYSGLLASLGGTCIADIGGASDDAMIAGLRWIDRVSPGGDGCSLLETYLKDSTHLLRSGDVRIREATRDVLGSELSPRLFPHLLEVLSLQLDIVFDRSESEAADGASLFIEQIASLLKSILNRLEQCQESFPSVDVGSLTVRIGQYLQSKGRGSHLRTKIKVCQLYEALGSKKDSLTLRQDVRVRNQLVEFLFCWMSGIGSSHSQIEHRLFTGEKEDDVPRLQRDLDKACLKGVAALSSRLPVQSSDSLLEILPSTARPQIFQNYFNKLISLLQSSSNGLGRKDMSSLHNDEHGSSSELVITALSNLLSANIDVGLQQCIGMAYHEDLAVRTAFLRILNNILLQGTEFSSNVGGIIGGSYDRLLECLLTERSVILLMYDCCPSSQVDEMAISLFNIFASRGEGLRLLEILIDHEVSKSENETELLRRNCVATKMLSIYAKWKGASYLRTTLQGVLHVLLRDEGALVLEMDPTRTSSTEELQHNVLQLRAVSSTFIDAICTSGEKVPRSFRIICNIITRVVASRFPDARFTAVGAFIFLRFFCPAIVAPDAEGLMSSAPPKDVRRGLLLVAKVVQNLANNVLFGAKEPYMFPLNDFLTENIYPVTAFLRELSAPIPGDTNETDDTVESFDFAACVDLHRILYEHSDILKRRLLDVKSVAEQKSLVSLDRFERLVSDLGIPSISMSWTRPSVTANLPVLYSRFQSFMLENAGRNAEDFASTGAIYDGGQSKDGLPIICVILRNIKATLSTEDLLIYSYFKVASKMWQRPYAILLDATCADSSNEPDDRIIKKLESLRPMESSHNLSRVYIYNMNSSSRKWFRRLLRLVAKDRQNTLHPSNVEYYLLGSLQELQQHFHLGALHLPKDTISVVTDSKFVFEPVTRLSKTKGRVEMVIKIGGQFVQITTVQKQDIVPGFRFSGTVNDIFNVQDVEETGTSLQTEDDGAFGLRTEGGKIAMYFTSPRRSDILLAIRAAKVRQGRESRRLGDLERSTRPEDVPGSLLNISLLNLAAEESSLRVSAFNLLCTMCRTFDFSVDRRYISAKGTSPTLFPQDNQLRKGDISIPPRSVVLLTEISKSFADAEPQLTQDFLTEFFVSWSSSSSSQHALNILYMVPWLRNLRSNVMNIDSDGDKAKGRVVLLIRRLVDIFTEEPSLYACFQNNVCPVLSEDDFLTEVFLDELVKAALSRGLDWEHIDKLGSLAASFSTIITHGKVVARMRKILGRSSLRPTRLLADNAIWTEFCSLLRIYLALSFNSKFQAQHYIPELFHVITLAFNSGPLALRRTTHSLLVHILQSMCEARYLLQADLARLRAILASLSEPKLQLLFNIQARTTKEESSDSSTIAQTSIVTATETLTNLLLEIIAVGATSAHHANAWRSRWMSLVASTAFQNNPAIQCRAFVIMGCLTTGDVDDDLLYQVLVSLRIAIGRYVSGNDELLSAIIPTLTKLAVNLPVTSRYILQMFWLGISLVRFSTTALYNSAAEFLGAVLKAIARNTDLGGDLLAILFQGRSLIEDASNELDNMFGIHFSHENLYIATCATIMKALAEPFSRSMASEVLSIFLGVITRDISRRPNSSGTSVAFPYIAFPSKSFSPADNTGGLATSAEQENSLKLSVEAMGDHEVLLNAALCVLELRSREDLFNQRTLDKLVQIARLRPRALAPLYNPLVDALDGIILSAQSAPTLRAAHALGSVLAASAGVPDLHDPDQMLQSIFTDAGLEGLLSDLHSPVGADHQKACGALIERLIESMIT